MNRRRRSNSPTVSRMQDHGPTAPALQVKDVEVTLANKRVLHDVNIELLPGQVAGLIGPNGAGKTTLMRSILGVQTTDKGEVLLHGRNTREARALLGYVPQRHEMAWDFPVSIEEVVMTGRTKTIGMFRRPGRADWDAVDDALELVGMSDLAQRPVGQLSGGQKQRVLVARALANDPRVLLLDEPFTGVDLPTQEAMTAVISHLSRNGVTVFMTTHDVAAASGVCGKVILLNRTVIAQGTPEELENPEIWLKAFGVRTSEHLVAALGVK